MFIACKTDDGKVKGKISFYCKVLHVSRQAFNKFLKRKDAPWKYQSLADAIIDRIAHDSYRINITSIDEAHDISMREVYGLDKSLRE